MRVDGTSLEVTATQCGLSRATVIVPLDACAL